MSESAGAPVVGSRLAFVVGVSAVLTGTLAFRSAALAQTVTWGEAFGYAVLASVAALAGGAMVRRTRPLLFGVAFGVSVGFVLALGISVAMVAMLRFGAYPDMT